MVRRVSQCSLHNNVDLTFPFRLVQINFHNSDNIKFTFHDSCIWQPARDSPIQRYSCVMCDVRPLIPPPGLITSGLFYKECCLLHVGRFWLKPSNETKLCTSLGMRMKCKTLERWRKMRPAFWFAGCWRSYWYTGLFMVLLNVKVYM